MEAKSKYSPNIKPYMKTHDILDSVDGFSHITINYNGIPPIKIKTKPTIFIMKRKMNIRYDSVKGKVSKDPNEELIANLNDPKQFDLNSGIPDTDFGQIGTVLEDIEASLEAFGKPLDQATSNLFMQENLPIIVDEINENSDDSERNLEPSAEDKYESIDVESKEKPEIEAIERIESSDEPGLDEFNEVLHIAEDDLELSMIDDAQVGGSGECDAETGAEASIDPVVLENLKLDDQKTMGSLKKSVKKLIRKKIEEVKLKKENIGVKEFGDNVESMNEKRDIKVQKRNVQDKLNGTEKVRQVLKRESGETNEPSSENSKAHKRKIIHVKESIRDIINQFKEFERDLASENQASLKKLNYDEFSDYSSEYKEEIGGGISLEESIVEMDKYVVETEDIGEIKGARKNLKEIIDQFKELKNELSSDEDDRFDEISVDYIKRPISETLMMFSEALKDLVLRRKLKSANKSSSKVMNIEIENEMLDSKLENSQPGVTKKSKLKTAGTDTPETKKGDQIPISLDTESADSSAKKEHVKKQAEKTIFKESHQTTATKDIITDEEISKTQRNES